MSDLQKDPGPDEDTAETVRVPTRERVEVQEVVSEATPPLPDELVPPHPVGSAAEPVRPRVVTEDERMRVEEDGSVSRRVARVEHDPVRRRRGGSLVPALLIVLALALGVIAAAWYFSRSDTKQVPSVVGLALDDAVSRLQDDGFRADIGSEPNAAVRGTVFHQSPGPATEQDSGSTVQLLVSNGPADVTVPNAVGVSETVARDRLATAGLRARVFRVFSSSPAGEVVAQAPAAGLRVAKESAVRLNVSKGSGVVGVPSLVGLSQGDATAQLGTAGLEANVVPVPSAEPAGTVVAQNPPAARQVRRGSTVRLNVSKGS